MTDEATGRSDSLAGTPPIGWNSWNAFEKEVDAERFERQAEALVDIGMAELGYEYVVIDGGWRAPKGPRRPRYLRPHMSGEHLAFVGTDGTGETLHSYRVDADGNFQHLDSMDAGGTVMFVAVHPRREVLYAVDTVEDGTVAAVGFDRERGTLEELNRRSTEGGVPCYCSVLDGHLLVANFAGGSISVLPTEDDGHLGAVSDTHVHEDPDDPDRAANPHAVVPGPDGQYVYAPDRGNDYVAVYDFEDGRLEPAACGPGRAPEGAGPRHLAFGTDGRVAYVINEHGSTLTAFERDAATGALTELATVPTIPGEYDGENHCADVHVHPSGAYVYGSNRGHDSIAVFEIEEGRPRQAGRVESGGEWPWDLELAPGGERLYAANRDGGGLVGFDLDPSTGDLTPRGRVAAVERPIHMTILPDTVGQNG